MVYVERVRERERGTETETKVERYRTKSYL